MKKILFFAPHPDDEILGCGGSIIKATNKGYDVNMCYLTCGEQGSPKYSPAKLKLLRKKEAMSVCKFLKIKNNNIYFLHIPDNNISCHDFESYKKIMELIRKIKPELVYIPQVDENYHDHRQASLLIQRALDMAGSNNFKAQGTAWWVENVLAYEISTPMKNYQYAEDISREINKKIKALELYNSQTSQKGNTSDFIGEKAKFLPGFRAAMTIGEYREVFQVIRVANIL